MLVLILHIIDFVDCISNIRCNFFCTHSSLFCVLHYCTSLLADGLKAYFCLALAKIVWPWHCVTCLHPFLSGAESIRLNQQLACKQEAARD